MTATHHVPVIGLVGGIGSGKSAVARWVANHRNITLLDGDQAGHQVLKQSTPKRMIREVFGDEIFDAEGEVNRKKLAARVFGSTPSHQTARGELERIVHPAIKNIFHGIIGRARASQETQVVILDAAILLEAGWDEFCDAVIFVDTPNELRLQRVQSNRQWSELELDQREASQLPLKIKRSRADFIISNVSDVAEAGRQLEHQINQILDRQPRRSIDA